MIVDPSNPDLAIAPDGSLKQALRIFGVTPKDPSAPTPEELRAANSVIVAWFDRTPGRSQK